MKIQSITIRGYKSFREIEEFQLRNLNIIVGANGAGKSNFLSFFKFASALAQGNLQTYVQAQGGPDALLYGTRKTTSHLDMCIAFQPGINSDQFMPFTQPAQLNLRLKFQSNRNIQPTYAATLIPTVDNRLIFSHEKTQINSCTAEFGNMGEGHSESLLPKYGGGSKEGFKAALQSWKQYHFHDTSDTAAVKRPQSSSDNLVLKAAADNLAAYLLRLQSEYPDYYQRIIDTIKLAAPFFGGFVMRKPVPENIQLEWFEQRDPDTPYKAHVLSDGTLRFICLATLLMQPPELLPDTVLLDEPELGLHPYAINLLADMLKQVAEGKQVLVATQSVELLNCFKPEDVVVAERQDDATILKRLDTEELKDWLEDYSLGELWKRNVFGGRPA